MESVPTRRESREAAIFAKIAEMIGRENVHGVDDVKYALSFLPMPKNIEPFLYSEEDVEAVRGLQEAGIEQMLALVPTEGSLSGTDMAHQISRRFKELHLGDFLHRNNDGSVTFENEPFFTKGSAEKESDIKFRWRFFTKESIPGIENKVFDLRGWGNRKKEKDTQEYAIQEFADKYHLERVRLRRPGPVEIYYLAGLHRLAAYRRHSADSSENWLLREQGHFLDILSSDGRHVSVNTTHDGKMTMYEEPSGMTSDKLGIYLSLDPTKKQ